MPGIVRAVGEHLSHGENSLPCPLPKIDLGGRGGVPGGGAGGASRSISFEYCSRTRFLSATAVVSFREPKDNRRDCGRNFQLFLGEIQRRGTASIWGERIAELEVALDAIGHLAIEVAQFSAPAAWAARKSSLGVAL